MTLDELVTAGHGFVGAADVRRHGLTRALRTAVARGDIERVGRGRYVSAKADEAVRLAARAGGVLSCASAATVLGLPLVRPAGPVHLTVPRGTVADLAGCVVHRRNVSALGIATTPERTVADCLRCLSGPAAVTVADAALHRGLVTVDGVEAQLRGRGSARPRSLLQVVDGRSMSPGESLLRLALVALGLQVTPQHFVAGVGSVDLLVGDRLVVEVDGFTYHSSRREFLIDRRRDAALQRLGYVVLRIPHDDVVFAIGHVVAVVLETLAHI